jgi:CheY-like chemotaxis protein
MNPNPVDILLVEDNADHVELILKVLQENRVFNEVHVVSDGEEAVEYLYQRGKFMEAPRPGLILLDIKLPKVDGKEVLRRIKADPALKSIPVVVLTTSIGEREMMESYKTLGPIPTSSSQWALRSSRR